MQETQETGFDQGSGRFPGVGNSNPLQYSCLENSTDRGAWKPTAHGVAESRTGLSNWAHTYTVIWDRTQKQQCNIAFEGEASKILIGVKSCRRRTKCDIVTGTWKSTLWCSWWRQPVNATRRNSLKRQIKKKFKNPLALPNWTWLHRIEIPGVYKVTRCEESFFINNFRAQDERRILIYTTYENIWYYKY